MKAFQSNLSKLEGADTQVLGVSMDSPFSNFAFAQQTGVTFPLVGDWGGKVTREYGRHLSQTGKIVCKAEDATVTLGKNAETEATLVEYAKKKER